MRAKTTGPSFSREDELPLGIVGHSLQLDRATNQLAGKGVGQRLLLSVKRACIESPNSTSIATHGSFVFKVGKAVVGEACGGDGVR